MKPARTPTVLQLEAAECGAASLAMVLGYFKRFLPLDELRTLCGVSRDGSKASNILKAARSLGLTAKGLKADPEALADLPTPMIAFVNFNHFLVVEGVHNDEVWINDPAGGHRKEAMEDFNLGYTGVVLTFTPNEDFKASDTRPSVIESLLQRLVPFRQALWFVLLSSMLMVAVGLVLPFFSQVFVDYVLVRSLDDWLMPLLIGMGITAVFRFGLGVMQEFALLKLDAEMKGQSGEALMRHLLRLPISFFEQRFAGEIADRVRLNEELVELLTGSTIQAVLNVVLAVFFLVVMLFIHMPLTILIVLLALLNVGVLLYVTPLISEKYRQASIDSGKLSGARISGFKDVETFKASGGEEMLFNRWSGLHANVINGSQRIAGITAWVGSVPSLIQALTVLVTLLGGGYAVMQGQMTLGTLVAFQSLALSFSGPITALTGFTAELQELRSFLGRIDDTLEQKVSPEFTHEDTTSLSRLPRGKVELRGASFGYNPLDPPLIDNFNLTIQPGERIALVGASGSGKSTIGKMIGGLVGLQTGEVLFDDAPARQWHRQALASRLAYVRQEVSLFKGTIAENITLWDSSISEQQMVQAAQDAAIHDTITARPGGYDAEVEEGANNLSGGEKQRIELARALATDPAIIILDEATSALDPVTELAVMNAIRRRGLSCVVIAHRLSSIRDCDEIIVLDQGHLLERGTHQELLNSGGQYAKLLEA